MTILSGRPLRSILCLPVTPPENLSPRYANFPPSGRARSISPRPTVGATEHIYTVPGYFLSLLLKFSSHSHWLCSVRRFPENPLNSSSTWRSVFCFFSFCLVAAYTVVLCIVQVFTSNGEGAMMITVTVDWFQLFLIVGGHRILLSSVVIRKFPFLRQWKAHG